MILQLPLRLEKNTRSLVIFMLIYAVIPFRPSVAALHHTNKESARIVDTFADLFAFFGSSKKDDSERISNADFEQNSNSYEGMPEVRGEKEEPLVKGNEGSEAELEESETEGPEKRKGNFNGNYFGSNLEKNIMFRRHKMRNSAEQYDNKRKESNLFRSNNKEAPIQDFPGYLAFSEPMEDGNFLKKQQTLRKNVKKTVGQLFTSTAKYAQRIFKKMTGLKKKRFLNETSNRVGLYRFHKKVDVKKYFEAEKYNNRLQRSVSSKFSQEGKKKRSKDAFLFQNTKPIDENYKSMDKAKSLPNQRLFPAVWSNASSEPHDGQRVKTNFLFIETRPKANPNYFADIYQNTNQLYNEVNSAEKTGEEFEIKSKEAAKFRSKAVTPNLMHEISHFALDKSDNICTITNDFTNKNELKTYIVGESKPDVKISSKNMESSYIPNSQSQPTTIVNFRKNQPTQFLLNHYCPNEARNEHSLPNKSIIRFQTEDITNSPIEFPIEFRHIMHTPDRVPNTHSKHFPYNLNVISDRIYPSTQSFMKQTSSGIRQYSESPIPDKIFLKRDFCFPTSVNVQSPLYVYQSEKETMDTSNKLGVLNKNEKFYGKFRRAKVSFKSPNRKPSFQINANDVSRLQSRVLLQSIPSSYNELSAENEKYENTPLLAVRSRNLEKRIKRDHPHCNTSEPGETSNSMESSEKISQAEKVQPKKTDQHFGKSQNKRVNIPYISTPCGDSRINIQQHIKQNIHVKEMNVINSTRPEKFLAEMHPIFHSDKEMIKTLSNGNRKIHKIKQNTNNRENIKNTAVQNGKNTGCNPPLQQPKIVASKTFDCMNKITQQDYKEALSTETSKLEIKNSKNILTCNNKENLVKKIFIYQPVTCKVCKRPLEHETNSEKKIVLVEPINVNRKGTNIKMIINNTLPPGSKNNKNNECYTILIQNNRGQKFKNNLQCQEKSENQVKNSFFNKKDKLKSESTSRMWIKIVKDPKDLNLNKKDYQKNVIKLYPIPRYDTTSKISTPKKVASIPSTQPSLTGVPFLMILPIKSTQYNKNSISPKSGKIYVQNDDVIKLGKHIFTVTDSNSRTDESTYEINGLQNELGETIDFRQKQAACVVPRNKPLRKQIIHSLKNLYPSKSKYYQLCNPLRVEQIEEIGYVTSTPLVMYEKLAQCEEQNPVLPSKSQEIPNLEKGAEKCTYSPLESKLTCSQLSETNHQTLKEQVLTSLSTESDQICNQEYDEVTPNTEGVTLKHRYQSSSTQSTMLNPENTTEKYECEYPVLSTSYLQDTVDTGAERSFNSLTAQFSEIPKITNIPQNEYTSKEQEQSSSAETQNQGIIDGCTDVSAGSKLSKEIKKTDHYYLPASTRLDSPVKPLDYACPLIHKENMSKNNLQNFGDDIKTNEMQHKIYFTEVSNGSLEKTIPGKNEALSLNKQSYKLQLKQASQPLEQDTLLSIQKQRNLHNVHPIQSGNLTTFESSTNPNASSSTEVSTSIFRVQCKTTVMQENKNIKVIESNKMVPIDFKAQQFIHNQTIDPSKKFNSEDKKFQKIDHPSRDNHSVRSTEPTYVVKPKIEEEDGINSSIRFKRPSKSCTVLSPTRKIIHETNCENDTKIESTDEKIHLHQPSTEKINYEEGKKIIMLDPFFQKNVSSYIINNSFLVKPQLSYPQREILKNVKPIMIIGYNSTQLNKENPTKVFPFSNVTYVKFNPEIIRRPLNPYHLYSPNVSETLRGMYPFNKIEKHYMTTSPPRNLIPSEKITFKMTTETPTFSFPAVPTSSSTQSNSGDSNTTIIPTSTIELFTQNSETFSLFTINDLIRRVNQRTQGTNLNSTQSNENGLQTYLKDNDKLPLNTYVGKTILDLLGNLSSQQKEDIVFGPSLNPYHMYSPNVSETFRAIYPSINTQSTDKVFLDLSSINTTNNQPQHVDSDYSTSEKSPKRIILSSKTSTTLLEPAITTQKGSESILKITDNNLGKAQGVHTINESEIEKIGSLTTKANNITQNLNTVFKGNNKKYYRIRPESQSATDGSVTIFLSTPEEKFSQKITLMEDQVLEKSSTKSNELNFNQDTAIETRPFDNIFSTLKQHDAAFDLTDWQTKETNANTGRPREEKVSLTNEETDEVTIPTGPIRMKTDESYQNNSVPDFFSVNFSEVTTSKIPTDLFKMPNGIATLSENSMIPSPAHIQPVTISHTQIPVNTTFLDRSNRIFNERITNENIIFSTKPEMNTSRNWTDSPNLDESIKKMMDRFYNRSDESVTFKDANISKTFTTQLPFLKRTNMKNYLFPTFPQQSLQNNKSTSRQTSKYYNEELFTSTSKFTKKVSPNNVVTTFIYHNTLPHKSPNASTPFNLVNVKPNEQIKTTNVSITFSTNTVTKNLKSNNETNFYQTSEHFSEDDIAAHFTNSFFTSKNSTLETPGKTKSTDPHLSLIVPTVDPVQEYLNYSLELLKKSSDEILKKSMDILKAGQTEDFMKYLPRIENLDSILSTLKTLNQTMPFIQKLENQPEKLRDNSKVFREMLPSTGGNRNGKAENQNIHSTLFETNDVHSTENYQVLKTGKQGSGLTNFHFTLKPSENQTYLKKPTNKPFKSAISLPGRNNQYSKRRGNQYVNDQLTKKKGNIPEELQKQLLMEIIKNSSMTLKEFQDKIQKLNQEVQRQRQLLINLQNTQAKKDNRKTLHNLNSEQLNSLLESIMKNSQNDFTSHTAMKTVTNIVTKKLSTAIKAVKSENVTEFSQSKLPFYTIKPNVPKPSELRENKFTEETGLSKISFEMPNFNKVGSSFQTNSNLICFTVPTPACALVDKENEIKRDKVKNKGGNVESKSVTKVSFQNPCKGNENTLVDIITDAKPNETDNSLNFRKNMQSSGGINEPFQYYNGFIKIALKKGKTGLDDLAPFAVLSSPCCDMTNVPAPYETKFIIEKQHHDSDNREGEEPIDNKKELKIDMIDNNSTFLNESINEADEVKLNSDTPAESITIARNELNSILPDSIDDMVNQNKKIIVNTHGTLKFDNLFPSHSEPVYFIDKKKELQSFEYLPVRHLECFNSLESTSSSSFGNTLHTNFETRENSTKGGTKAIAPIKHPSIKEPVVTDFSPSKGELHQAYSTTDFRKRNNFSNENKDELQNLKNSVNIFKTLANSTEEGLTQTQNTLTFATPDFRITMVPINALNNSASAATTFGADNENNDFTFKSRDKVTTKTKNQEVIKKSRQEYQTGIVRENLEPYLSTAQPAQKSSSKSTSLQSYYSFKNSSERSESEPDVYGTTNTMKKPTQLPAVSWCFPFQKSLLDPFRFLNIQPFSNLDIPTVQKTDKSPELSSQTYDQTLLSTQSLLPKYLLDSSPFDKYPTIKKLNLQSKYDLNSTEKFTSYQKSLLESETRRRKSPFNFSLEESTTIFTKSNENVLRQKNLPMRSNARLDLAVTSSRESKLIHDSANSCTKNVQPQGVRAITTSPDIFIPSQEERFPINLVVLSKNETVKLDGRSLEKNKHMEFIGTQEQEMYTVLPKNERNKKYPSAHHESANPFSIFKMEDHSMNPFKIFSDNNVQPLKKQTHPREGLWQLPESKSKYVQKLEYSQFNRTTGEIQDLKNVLEPSNTLTELKEVNISESYEKPKRMRDVIKVSNPSKNNILTNKNTKLEIVNKEKVNFHARTIDSENGPKLTLPVDSMGFSENYPHGTVPPYHQKQRYTVRKRTTNIILNYPMCSNRRSSDKTEFIANVSQYFKDSFRPQLNPTEDKMELLFKPPTLEQQKKVKREKYYRYKSQKKKKRSEQDREKQTKMKNAGRNLKYKVRKRQSRNDEIKEKNGSLINQITIPVKAGPLNFRNSEKYRHYQSRERAYVLHALPNNSAKDEILRQRLTFVTSKDFISPINQNVQTYLFIKDSTPYDNITAEKLESQDSANRLLNKPLQVPLRMIPVQNLIATVTSFLTTLQPTNFISGSKFTTKNGTPQKLFLPNISTKIPTFSPSLITVWEGSKENSSNRKSDNHAPVDKEQLNLPFFQLKSNIPQRGSITAFLQTPKYDMRSPKPIWSRPKPFETSRGQIVQMYSTASPLKNQDAPIWYEPRTKTQVLIHELYSKLPQSYSLTTVPPELDKPFRVNPTIPIHFKSTLYPLAFKESAEWEDKISPYIPKIKQVSAIVRSTTRMLPANIRSSSVMTYPTFFNIDYAQVENATLANRRNITHRKDVMKKIIKKMYKAGVHLPQKKKRLQKNIVSTTSKGYNCTKPTQTPAYKDGFTTRRGGSKIMTFKYKVKS